MVIVVVDACVAAPAWLDIENNITLDLVLLAWGPPHLS